MTKGGLMDAQSPKGWTFTLGLAVLAVVAAFFARATPAPRVSTFPWKMT